jgi:SNF2 family DNA or RNA helicase
VWQGSLRCSIDWERVLNFGKVSLVDYGNGRAWRIETQPHIMVRLKRVFERINKKQIGVAYLDDTPINGRELYWFLQRFPMEVDPAEELERRVAEHKEMEEKINRLLHEKYEAPHFDLALPPREYQRLAADMVLTSGRLLLADDVGLGKTVSAICTLTDPETLPALVVTLTHLPRQWEAEINKFAPKLRTHIVKKGTPYDLCKGPRGKKVLFPDVIIISYSKLKGWADVLLPVIRSVVYDECQELRHSDSLKYHAALRLSEVAKYRMGLSATPIYNYGGEFYHVMQTICPDGLGKWDEFQREWCTHTYGDKPRIGDPKAFGTYMRQEGFMLRRTRQDVKRELPALSIIPHYIDANLSELQKVESNAAELARIILQQQGETKRGEKMMAAQELSWVLRKATGLAKAPYVAEFVKLMLEQEEKVVLYGWHHEVYDLWRDMLRGYSPAFYTGEQSIPQKEEAKRRFVEGETPLLIISLRAGAGLDGLQHVCHNVVFGELDWSPGVHEQCIGRVYRDGQPDPVSAYYLISEHGSDPVVADVLQIKKQQIEGTRDPDAELIENLDTGEDNIKRLAEQFLKARSN